MGVLWEIFEFFSETSVISPGTARRGQDGVWQRLGPFLRILPKLVRASEVSVSKI